METQYHQFGSAENSSVHVQGEIIKIPTLTGRRNIVFYVLYGVLVLLLLILLMVTGLKLSQLSKDISDVKLHLQRNEYKTTSGTKTDNASKYETVLLEPLIPVRGRCREGWWFYQNKCYLLATNPVNWNKAEEACRTHGAHLLVLNDINELDYISRIIDIRYNTWIGLVERQHEGHWSWVDGTDFSSTQTFWDEGQPDNWDFRENGEDCGQLHSSDQRKRMLWNDADCSLPYRYICETTA